MTVTAMAVPIEGDGPVTEPESLTARIARVCGHLNVLNGQLVQMTKAAIDSDAWSGYGIRSVEHWLTLQAGLSPARAREVVALARRAEELPATLRALREGRLSLDQVAPIVQHVPAWADEEASRLATHTTPAQLRATMRRYSFSGKSDADNNDDGSGAEPDGRDKPDPDDPKLAQAKLEMGHDGGRFRLTFDAPVDLGELVELAIREAKDALIGAGVDPQVTLADGLAEVCRRSLGSIDSGPRSDRYRVYAHLDKDGGWLNAGPALPPSLLAKLTCDGLIIPLWETQGRPVDVGRAHRVVPARTRRLAEDRDRGCRFPGCTARRWVEVHHIIHWRQGGVTELWNLVCLCPFHHDAHHRGEYTITGNANRPDGLVFRTRHELPIGPTSPRPPDRPPPGPPDGTSYQRPSGERIQRKWLYFNPPPNAA